MTKQRERGLNEFAERIQFRVSRNEIQSRADKRTSFKSFQLLYPSCVEIIKL